MFVSDGSKCDCGNLLDVFGSGIRVAVVDPVYPVYVDTNVMAGNSGEAADNGQYAEITYLPVTEANGFVPELPSEPVDLIYLCYPNNPTGVVATHEDLRRWVDYAREQSAIILFDAAYEAFITSPDIPRSIFEIEGAHDVAIEFRSFSKTAGFTGTRCAFMVIPKTLKGAAPDGSQHSIHALWSRRHSTKFNGVPYIVQRGAAAAYSDEGRAQIQQLVRFYLEKRAAHENAIGSLRVPGIWRRTCAVCLAQDSGFHVQLGLF